MSEHRKDEQELEPKMHGDGADLEPAGDSEPQMHGDGAAEEPRREGRQVMRGDGAEEVPKEEPKMTASGAVEREGDPDANDSDPPATRRPAAP